MNGYISIDVHTISGSKASVSITGPGGQRLSDKKMLLPWLDDLDWAAVYTVLEAQTRKVGVGLRKEVLERGIALGLIDANGYTTDDRLKKVGEQLYKSLLVSQYHMGRFETWVYPAEPDDEKDRGLCLLVKLHLSGTGSMLHAYPWELLCSEEDHKFFFNTTNVQISRSINLNEPSRGIPASENLNILVVDPRPQIPKYPALGQSDRSILEVLKATYGSDLCIYDLSGQEGSTLNRLFQFFQDQAIKMQQEKTQQAFILHFDTHGSYGWMCLECNQINPPGAASCGYCSYPPAKKTESLGYLALDDGSGNVMWVHGERLARQLVNCPIQMVMLSACKSAKMGGATPFNSFAGALIHDGIPAVIAVQSSIEVKAAREFAHGLYSAWLFQDMDLVDCMAKGRQKLGTFGNDDGDWFRPVLYLSNDPNNPRGKMVRTGTGFKREDTLSRISDFFTKYQRGRNQFRLNNYCAQEGIGKTNILLSANTELRKNYLVVYVPLKRYLFQEEAGAVFGLTHLQADLISEIRIRLSERTRLDIPAPIPRTDKDEMAELLRALAQQAEEAGFTPRLLFDDVDLLLKKDIDAFVLSALQPLMPYTQVIVTSAEPVGPYLKRYLQIPVETWIVPPLPVQAVKEQLPREHRSLAEKITRDAAGYPRIARDLVNQVKDAPLDAPKEQLEPDIELLREVIAEQQRPGIEIQTMLAVLRWFNLNMMKSILPKLLTGEKQEYSEPHYLKLIQGLGGQVEWKNQGVGGWRIQPHFKKLACQLIQQENPAEYRRIHQAAYDSYHDLLMHDKQQGNPDLIIEMVYHGLELLKLDTAKDSSEFYRFKNVSITQEFVTAVLGSIFQNLGKTDTLFMEEISALLRLDEDIRDSLPEDFVYRQKNS